MKSIFTIIAYMALSFSFLYYAGGQNEGEEVAYVAIKTKAPSNKLVRFYYRIPEGAKQDSDKLYRVLVLFGGRNCTGKEEAKGGLGFDNWADEDKIFIVAPGFKDDEYWQPEQWSGKTLLKALDEIKKKYPISTDNILYYGSSGGAQCSNLFPAWKPKICRAWVSHACGLWHQASKKLENCPGLVTCGEADIGRYELSRRLVMEYRRKGVNIIWKSFPNTGHDVPTDSVELARVFLKYYHEKNIDDLIPEKREKGAREKREKNTVLFVGDDQEGRFWKAGSREIEDIDIEERVEFESHELADAWGREAKSRMN